MQTIPFSVRARRHPDLICVRDGTTALTNGDLSRAIAGDRSNVSATALAVTFLELAGLSPNAPNADVDVDVACALASSSADGAFWGSFAGLPVDGTLVACASPSRYRAVGRLAAWALQCGSVVDVVRPEVTELAAAVGRAKSPVAVFSSERARDDMRRQRGWSDVLASTPWVLPLHGRHDDDDNIVRLRFGKRVPVPDVNAYRASRSIWERDELESETAVATPDGRLTFGELAGLVAGIAGVLAARPPGAVLLQDQDGAGTIPWIVGARMAGRTVAVVRSASDAAVTAREFGCEPSDVMHVTLSGRSPRTVVAEVPDRSEVLHAQLLEASFSRSAIAARKAGPLATRTSGTTGRGRLVAGLATNVPPSLSDALDAHFARFLGLPDRGLHLVAGSLVHGSHLTTALTAMAGGSGVYLMPTWDPAALLDTIDRERATSLFLVPSMVGDLLDVRASTRVDTSSIRVVIHGGTRLEAQRKRELIHSFPSVTEVYSTSEAPGTMITADEWLRRPGSVGFPLPGASVRVAAPPGEPGRVVLRGSGTLYLEGGDQVGNRFEPGDFGVLDEDAALTLVGRDAELAVVSGAKVNLRHVEEVLETHPRVDAAHVSVRSGATLTFLEADVVVRSDVSVHELLSFGAERLRVEERPRRIRIVERLRLTDAGKRRLVAITNGV